MRREPMERVGAGTRHPLALPAPPETWPATASHGLMALQRAAGNQAVSGLVRNLQRCGGETHAGCACATGGSASVDELTGEPQVGGASLQRTTSGWLTTAAGGAPGASMVQRDDEKNPADLTGTPFEKLDGTLQKVLKDKAVFAWSKPTLAETLGETSNASVATMARIGAMISATAPFLWAYVKRIGLGDWITDNFGMRVEWTDGAGLGGKLATDPNFCKDNPATAKWYHGTTSAFRQISRQPGAPSMHVITAGTTEIHIDVHQPVESKEESWPWTGQCNYDLSAWWDHAGDVTGGGGAGGARGTPIGRYARAKDNLKGARRSAYYEKDKDEPQLGKAEQSLKAIEMMVQKYAALGGMVGNQWEGDQQMLKDTPTMERLKAAEELIREVDLAQFDRRPDEMPVGP